MRATLEAKYNLAERNYLEDIKYLSGWRTAKNK
jgi:hypothetical protein